jgi:hypothetical protein
MDEMRNGVAEKGAGKKSGRYSRTKAWEAPSTFVESDSDPTILSAAARLKLAAFGARPETPGASPVLGASAARNGHRATLSLATDHFVRRSQLHEVGLDRCLVDI